MATRTRFNFGFNPNAARYVDLNTGRFVSQDYVLGVVESRIQEGQERVSDLLYGALQGTNRLDDWQEAMALELKRAHLETAALGKGGWNQMEPADFGRVGQTLRQEYGYLRQFADDINQGKLSLAQIEARAKQYEAKIWNAYWNGNLAAQQARGMTQKRRVLDYEAEHCADCVEQAGLGWVAIDDPRVTTPASGDTACGSNDKCVMEFR